MLLRALQASLPTLLHRAGAAPLTTTASLRGLEELVVLPPKEGEKPAATGAPPSGWGGAGRWSVGNSSGGGGGGSDDAAQPSPCP